MDILHQRKLSRSEWESIEAPVSEEEKRVLVLIRDGYSNVSMRTNYTLNMIQFTKLDPSVETDSFLFQKYFKELVRKVESKSNAPHWTPTQETTKKLKAADTIRIQNADLLIQQNKHRIFEFLLLEYATHVCKSIHKKKSMEVFLCTLIRWRKASIPHTNRFLLEWIDSMILYGIEHVQLKNILVDGVAILEKNPHLFQCDDHSLFSHQKELFAICRTERSRPKLLMYTAPTGTGKTLSPIGLSQDYKIIFVCVARHIGLSLAKSAISIGKRVAFAFGAEQPTDIRLHYYAAIDYEVNKRSGGIGKVDNTNGNNVEIIICDVQSYLSAMHYMMAFHDPANILLYWDEPTMTLDYTNHDLHEVIHKNWSQNKIPNVILSCATLPHEEEIQSTIQHFRCQFENAFVHTITSYDCRKTIPILTAEGYCFLPHLHCDSWKQLRSYVDHCTKNKTLLRYFDLQSILDFLLLVLKYDFGSQRTKLHQYFVKEDIGSVQMETIKLYYLDVLQDITESAWVLLKKELQEKAKPKYMGRYQENEKMKGVSLTTSDAFTLTDGPSIYLVENVENLASFYAQQSKIPETVLQKLLQGIAHNEKLQKQIDLFEKELHSKIKIKSDTEEKTSVREKEGKDDSCLLLKENIDQLRKQFFMMSLDLKYIPNTPAHQRIWAPNETNAFVPSIDESTVKAIMDLELPRAYKVLILMGVGILIKQENSTYEEIVKRLAQEQKLFLILTSSDYIYGTNYQFCHGFIGKDLQNMTAHKTLQAMGRMGRNKHQQEYSVRFRDNNMIHRLFQSEANTEADNMNRLFCD